MLNPKAIEFNPHPLEYRNEEQQPQQQQQQRSSVQRSHIRHVDAANSATAPSKKQADSIAASGSNTKSRRKQQPQQPPQQGTSSKQQHGRAAAGRKKSRGDPPQKAQTAVRRESQQSTAIVSTLFDQPAKFITIEGVIDPVDQIGPKDQGEKRLIHGYERYIEWIARSLKTFGTVTVVGMDYAMADVVSLVTILQQRGIGEHEEAETFSLQQNTKRYTSGIQVKLHCV